MKAIISFIILAFSLNIHANDSIKIENPTIKFAPADKLETAIFFNMKNMSNKDVKLVSVKGDFAEKFEFFNIEVSGRQLMLRQLASVEVKSNASAELKCGGMQVFVKKLKNPLKEGDTHKISLIFDDNSTIEVEAKVENMPTH